MQPIEVYNWVGDTVMSETFTDVRLYPTRDGTESAVAAALADDLKRVPFNLKSCLLQQHVMAFGDRPMFGVVHGAKKPPTPQDIIDVIVNGPHNETTIGWMTRFFTAFKKRGGDLKYVFLDTEVSHGVDGIFKQFISATDKQGSRAGFMDEIWKDKRAYLELKVRGVAGVVGPENFRTNETTGDKLRDFTSSRLLWNNMVRLDRAAALRESVRDVAESILGHKVIVTNYRDQSLGRPTSNANGWPDRSASVTPGYSSPMLYMASKGALLDSFKRNKRWNMLVLLFNQFLANQAGSTVIPWVSNPFMDRGNKNKFGLDGWHWAQLVRLITAATVNGPVRFLYWNGNTSGDQFAHRVFTGLKNIVRATKSVPDIPFDTDAILVGSVNVSYSESLKHAQ